MSHNKVLPNNHFGNTLSLLKLQHLHICVAIVYGRSFIHSGVVCRWYFVCLDHVATTRILLVFYSLPTALLFIDGSCQRLFGINGMPTYLTNTIAWVFPINVVILFNIMDFGGVVPHFIIHSNGLFKWISPSVSGLIILKLCLYMNILIRIKVIFFSRMLDATQQKKAYWQITRG